MRHVHSFEVPKCAGRRGELSSFPSTADLRSSYFFPYSADFRFATLAAGCRSSQSFDVPTSLAKGLAEKSAHELSEFGWKSNFSKPLCYFP
ncbi:hypothetical protein AVEN_183603-1 [Araneus ventricosus]|uniref:Uncharacterized protein n=1 Tax=Araneus ventricosus TaxID=182803 RepID=A0A4Y2UJ66_ARAVE|nr:hypothetical protein AVEN_239632-1 [Araneus ventricosus]GBO12657.1 hypothetical protein AVEN_274753-1 [Araneus ventricosus]GBO12658.1 hypothetical protein AVEN_15292-1 [Araneus ventricosus]GBO12663.1 hypothetical protein AVEN_183603-1 [Araneus ventricosus]